jgi:hypothetical protein
MYEYSPESFSHHTTDIIYPVKGSYTCASWADFHRDYEVIILWQKAKFQMSVRSGQVIHVY